MMGEIRSNIDKVTLTERIEIKSGKWKTLSWFLQVSVKHSKSGYIEMMI